MIKTALSDLSSLRKIYGLNAIGEAKYKDRQFYTQITILYILTECEIQLFHLY